MQLGIVEIQLTRRQILRRISSDLAILFFFRLFYIKQIFTCCYIPIVQGAIGSTRYKFQVILGPGNTCDDALMTVIGSRLKKYLFKIRSVLVTYLFGLQYANNIILWIIAHLGMHPPDKFIYGGKRN